jgi:uncharacterized membrane protein YkvA (DUF1232 family)
MNLWKQIWRFVKMTRRVGGWKAARQLASEAPKQIALFRLLLTDPRVPVPAKAVLVGAILFALSPLNFPQYIPILGALDDIGIVLFAGNFFLKQVPASVLSEHRARVGLSDSANLA